MNIKNVKKIKLGVYVGPEGSGRAGPVVILWAPRSRVDVVPEDVLLDWDGERLNLDNLPPKFYRLVPPVYLAAPLAEWKPFLDAVAFEGSAVWTGEVFEGEKV